MKENYDLVVTISKEIQDSRIIVSYFISAFSCFTLNVFFHIAKLPLLFPETFLVEKIEHLK